VLSDTRWSNLVSGNAFSGVLVTGAGATGNKLFGNSIGTDAAGTGALPNSLYGVYLTESSNAVVALRPERGTSLPSTATTGSLSKRARVTASVAIPSTPTGPPASATTPAATPNSHRLYRCGRIRLRDGLR